MRERAFCGAGLPYRGGRRAWVRGLERSCNATEGRSVVGHCMRHLMSDVVPADWEMTADFAPRVAGLILSFLRVSVRRGEVPATESDVDGLNVELYDCCLDRDRPPPFSDNLPLGSVRWCRLGREDVRRLAGTEAV